MKNPEGIITKLDKIVEMKEIKSSAKKKIEERLREAIQQKPEIIVLNLKGEKKYTRQDAIEKTKGLIKEAIPKKVKMIDKSKLQGKKLEDALNMERGLEKLKEVWLIWDGKISKIKK